jgi:hypothetical protein
MKTIKLDLSTPSDNYTQTYSECSGTLGYRTSERLTDKMLNSSSNNNTGMDQNGGGFFDFINRLFDDNTDSTGMFVKLQNKDYKTILKGGSIDLNIFDQNKNSILHYVAKDYSSNKYAKKLGDYLLENPSLNNIINSQNNDGNTAAHIAIKNGGAEFVSKLDAKNADLSIKNKEGYHIRAEDVTETEKLVGGIMSEYNKTIKNIENPENTEEFIGKMLSKYNDITKNKDLFDSHPNSKLSQIGGNPESELEYMQGGAIKGKRQLRKLNKSKKSKKSKSRKFSSDLNRLVQNQASDLIRDSIKIIMDVMKVDEETAKNYKALFWDQVKREHGSKSNLEKAYELTALVKDKKNYKKLNPDDGIKIRDTNKKLKDERIRSRSKSSQSSKSDTSSQDGGSDSISPTSSFSVSNRDSLSSTSISNNNMYGGNNYLTSSFSVSNRSSLSSTSITDNYMYGGNNSPVSISKYYETSEMRTSDYNNNDYSETSVTPFS